MDALDAARGAAMVLVCVSHFAFAYLYQLGAPAASLLRAITMVASPAFILISGITLGHLYEARPNRRDALRVRLFDRAAFILLIVHPLLALAERTRHGSIETALQTGYITDTVALAMIAGPVLVSATRMHTRVLLGVACVAVTWWLLLLPGAAPHPLLRALGYSVIGSTTVPDVTRFPVLPWFGLYLIGTAIGQRFERERTVANSHALLMLIACGVASATIAATIRIASNLGTSPGVLDHIVLTVWQKHPPSPAYFLWFGGCALILIGLCGLLRGKGLPGFLGSWLRTLGQASLFVYVLQDFIYFAGFYRIRLAYTPYWPAILAATIVAVTLAARAWLGIDGNRMMTLGLPRLLRAVAARRVIERYFARDVTPS